MLPLATNGITLPLRGSRDKTGAIGHSATPPLSNISLATVGPSLTSNIVHALRQCPGKHAPQVTHVSMAGSFWSSLPDQHYAHTIWHQDLRSCQYIAFCAHCCKERMYNTYTYPAFPVMLPLATNGITLPLRGSRDKTGAIGHSATPPNL